MSFLDKFKSVTIEAGNKAKVMVEVNRLKMQNNSKQKEIDKSLHEIGFKVFNSIRDHHRNVSEEELNLIVERIVHLEGEIKDNNSIIKGLANEKDCICGKTSPKEARFCPSCGQTFQEEVVR